MISFFSEDIEFNLKGKMRIRKWINNIIHFHKHKSGDINIIFCSDNYLLEINNKFLNHNYYTDIITFDYCHGDIISGDLYISIDSVSINAADFKQSFDNELKRVIIHGILHLLKYDDYKDEDILKMRKAEDDSLKIFNDDK